MESTLRVGIDNISPGLSTSPQTIGGMRMYLTNLVESLSRDTDYQIVLFSPDWFDSPFPPDLVHLVDVRLPRVPISRVQRVVYEQTRYRTEIESARPDVFIGLCNSIPWGLNTPSAVFIKSLQFLYTPESFSFARRKYLQWVVRLSARQADILIVPTKTTGNDLERVTGVKSNKIRVVPEALYPRDSMIFQTGQGGELRDCIYRLTGNKPFILCVGATYPYKNLERLILAFARLKQRLKSDLRLLLVGAEGGVSYAMLRQLAQDAGVGESVVCAGRLSHDEITAAYKLAELMAMPTLYETFGHPVVEAMACGCPVVTSNRGAVAEVAAMAAELVDPLDIESITRGMQRILSDESRRTELVASGRARSAQFSWTQVTSQLSEILAELVGFRSSNPPGES